MMQEPIKPDLQTTGSTEDSRDVETHDFFIPLLLIALTLFIMMFFQSCQLVRQRDLLHTVIANQDAPLKEAQKVRKQLDSIAKSTLQLSTQGNENAKRLVEQLKSQGITINPATGPSK